MDNYTMTFKYDGDLDLPNDPDGIAKNVPALVLAKMESHEFELIDFNLTQNYSDDKAKDYIKDPYMHRSVLEIKLDLSMEDLTSREAIFDRCLEALREDRLCLTSAFENEDKQKGMLQSLINFSAKSNARVTAKKAS